VPGPQVTFDPADIDAALSGLIVLTPGDCPARTAQVDRVSSSTMLDHTINNAVEDGIKRASGWTGTTERTITSDGTLWFNLCQFP
jgi:hypothetical protein